MKFVLSVDCRLCWCFVVADIKVEFQFSPYVQELYTCTLNRLRAADIDQEVKERAISCMWVKRKIHPCFRLQKGFWFIEPWNSFKQLKLRSWLSNCKFQWNSYNHQGGHPEKVRGKFFRVKVGKFIKKKTVKFWEKSFSNVLGNVDIYHLISIFCQAIRNLLFAILLTNWSRGRTY